MYKIIVFLLGFCFLSSFTNMANRNDSSLQIKAEKYILTPCLSVDEITYSERFNEMAIPIKQNVSRVLAIKQWSKTKMVDLTANLGSGKAVFYYQGNTIEKIVIRKIDANQETLSEYFFKNGKVSLWIEKNIMWSEDGIKIPKEEQFTSEDLYFFNATGFVDFWSNQDCGAPWESTFLAEEKIRIDEQVKQLMKTVNTK